MIYYIDNDLNIYQSCLLMDFEMNIEQRIFARVPFHAEMLQLRVKVNTDRREITKVFKNEHIHLRNK